MTLPRLAEREAAGLCCVARRSGVTALRREHLNARTAQHRPCHTLMRGAVASGVVQCVLSVSTPSEPQQMVHKIEIYC